MDLIEKIAEKKISEAVRRGDLDNLPNAGKPLELEDLTMVPETLRGAYLLLKSNGFLPPEMTLRKQVNSAEALLARCDDGDERSRHSRRLTFLRLQLGVLSGNLVDVQERYRDKLNKHLD